MKNRKRACMTYLVLLMGVFIILTGSCKKDDNQGNGDKPEKTFIDPRDGIVYQTVTIGNQVWMAENLKYLPRLGWSGPGSNVLPAYYVYEYDGNDVKKAKEKHTYKTYGVMYNWPAAMDSSESSASFPSGVQGVCPPGWHLPSDAEWTELTDFLGGANVAGGKLKESDTTHWNAPNTGATNETGYTALPGGTRLNCGSYGHLGITGHWWSATESSTDSQKAYGRNMYNNSDRVHSWSGSIKGTGASVRCIKD